MSNKLYTEEKIRQKLYLMGYFDDEQIENFINDLTPIELPTDEDIEKEFTKGNQIFVDRIEGAKWMKSKIQGGNNGQ